MNNDRNTLRILHIYLNMNIATSGQKDIMELYNLKFDSCK